MQPSQDSGGRDLNHNVSSSEASSSTVISGGSISPSIDNDENDEAPLEQEHMHPPPLTLSGETTAEHHADLLAGDSSLDEGADESFDTAIQGSNNSYLFHGEEGIDKEGEKSDENQPEPVVSNDEEEGKAEESDDIQSVDSDTAVNGRLTQREQAQTDHSIIFGTYDESPVNTSGEADEEDLLNTSNTSSVHLPDYPTDEEENEIVFEEPNSPGGSVYSGLFGLSLWNTRAMSFDSQNAASKRPAPSPEYQQDRGMFWFWRNRGKSKNKKKRQLQTPGVSVDPQVPPIPAPNSIVSPARTVATEGTTSGVDTPMRGSRRRRRRMFPRLTRGNSSSDDDEHDRVVEIQSNDDDDLELGDYSRSTVFSHYRSGHRRSGRSGSHRVVNNPPKSDPSGSFHSKSSDSRTLRTGSRRMRTKTRRSVRSDLDGLGDSDHSVAGYSTPSDSSPVNLQYLPERAFDATDSRMGSSMKGAVLAAPSRVITDEEEDDASSFHAIQRRRAQYQLITFYRLLWLACIFVCLIISSSVVTAFVGTLLALDEADDDDPALPSVNEKNEGETANSTTALTNPCNDASAWLQMSLKFDSRPEETSIVLQGAGIFRSALWNFPPATFRSFTQFQRRNMFSICISRAATYELLIGDIAADGLVSTLGVSGLTTTIYGNWGITLDGVQRAVYNGNCASLPSNDTGVVLSHCGHYCQCSFAISSEEWTGGCKAECN